MVNNPRAMPAINPGAFEMRERLPIIVFSWGDHHAWPGTCACNFHVQMSASLKPNEKVETYEAHGQQTEGHASPIQTDAFQRWGRLPTCSFSWETFMHGRTPLHGAPMNLWKPSKQLDTYIGGGGGGGGGADFRCVVSHGGQPCVGRHMCMEPQCTAIHPIETQYTDGNLS